MSAAQVVFSLLSNDVQTTASVGGRIFPDVAPQDEPRPAIVYQIISVIPNNTQGANGQSSLDMSRVQITIGATTRKQADQIAANVKRVLNYVNNVVVAGFQVNWISFDSEVQYYDDFSDQDGLFLTAIDFKIAIQL
jgi:hypothetical protein